jgi:ABC-type glutathione transport system ATPase component
MFMIDIPTGAPAPSIPKLSLRNVSKNFHTKTGKFNAVQDINLEVHEGEFLCIVGPSGCGKSTVLNIVAGLEKPDGARRCERQTHLGPGTDRVSSSTLASSLADCPEKCRVRTEDGRCG